jgi:Tol biopolymer transport system component
VWVIYIDKPSPDAPVGLWGVDTTQPGATPQLLTERIANYTDDLTYVVEYGQGKTTITYLASPLSEEVIDSWSLPANGRPISISPNRTRIAWTVSNDDAPPELRVSEVWTANFDGTEPQSVARLNRGGFSGWITDDRLLLSGRESLESNETVLYGYSLIDGSMEELLRAERPRGYRLSPDRRWMIYYVSLSEEPAQNGLWLLRTDTGEIRQLSRELFGSFAWRDAHRLLIIPFRPDAQYHELWELDVETDTTRRLTDSTVTPFKVANADWQVSPDGRHVAFVDSRDDNLWMLTLGD